MIFGADWCSHVLSVGWLMQFDLFSEPLRCVEVCLGCAVGIFASQCMVWCAVHGAFPDGCRWGICRWTRRLTNDLPETHRRWTGGYALAIWDSLEQFCHGVLRLAQAAKCCKIRYDNILWFITAKSFVQICRSMPAPCPDEEQTMCRYIQTTGPVWCWTCIASIAQDSWCWWSCSGNIPRASQRMRTEPGSRF